MMTEMTNRFDSVLEGSVSGISVSTTFTVPAGCYFKGSVSYYNSTGTGSAAADITTPLGVKVATFGPTAALATGGINVLNVPLILNEGTYTVSSLSTSTTSQNISWHGICFRK